MLLKHIFQKNNQPKNDKTQKDEPDFKNDKD
jgi:hypothetical protein